MLAALVALFVIVPPQSLRAEVGPQGGAPVGSAPMDRGSVLVRFRPDVGAGDRTAALHELGHAEGIFAAPEAAATLAALKRLRASGDILEHQRVVLFITGSGLKYTHLIKSSSAG